jgi:Family of unknown function (DUF6526)
MAEATQSYANHRQYVPIFHFVTLPILLLNVIVRIVYAIMHLRARLVWWEIIVAIALLLLALATRAMVIAVQDRLIRLEETLRLQRVLPDDLRGRLGELSTGQLIALRFCGDEKELTDLTRSVLNGEVTSRNDIKKRIRTWRPDNARA